MKTLSVVIPVHNESGIIHELVKRLINTLEIIDITYEIIFIDDGSLDDTWSIIKSVNQSNKSIIGIRFSRNYGQHNAITAGIYKSKGDFVVVMDGDLQDRPEVIIDLYRKIHEGFDAVFVSRENRKDKVYYLVLQKIFYLTLNKITGLKFNSRQANFSILSKPVVNSYKEFSENTRFYPSIITWMGFNSTSINAEHGTRFAGRPAYTFRKRIKLASEIIVAFSVKPLKIAIYVGLFMSFLSAFTAIWIVKNAILYGYSVSGWASLMTSLFFIGGIIFIILGIIGVYIGQILREVKKRPIYTISESTF